VSPLIQLNGCRFERNKAVVLIHFQALQTRLAFTRRALIVPQTNSVNALGPRNCENWPARSHVRYGARMLGENGITGADQTQPRRLDDLCLV
jgi:hypothetical protein